MLFVVAVASQVLTGKLVCLLQIATAGKIKAFSRCTWYLCLTRNLYLTGSNTKNSNLAWFSFKFHYLFLFRLFFLCSPRSWQSSQVVLTVHTDSGREFRSHSWFNKLSAQQGNAGSGEFLLPVVFWGAKCCLGQFKMLEWAELFGMVRAAAVPWCCTGS